MSATPIPRTIALTLYGDLEMSTLEELPKGRKPITTWVVPPQKRPDAYSWVREKINEKNNQAYVICPLIEESEAEGMQQVKAATKEYEKLTKLFPGLKVDLLHGSQNSKEKNEALNKFKRGKTDILVSTPVVEVGIDVPNATIMIIEGAERFGLAQLHQLRGRVGRGEEKSYCLLFTESRSQEVHKRLNALKTTKSGFELAEIDLNMRGPGEIFGLRQHGFTEFKVANLQDTKMLNETMNLATDIVNNKDSFDKILKRLSPEKIALN
jgi:ATP-dependent DNA helicase RecG